MFSSNGMNTNIETDEDLIMQKAIEISRGLELPMAMKSAIELGILDIISEANKKGAYLSASEVAAKIPGCVNPNVPTFIDCVLSLLASFSVLKCEIRCKSHADDVEEKVYGVAPVCKYFLTNKVDGSIGLSLCVRYDKVSQNMWNHLTDAIKEGGSAFERAHGMNVFEKSKKDPKFSQLFQEAMSDYTLILMKKILDEYKGFEGINVLVDVGGGIAASLVLILSKYPNIRGVNFELPFVVADAPNYPGVEHIGGDMFEKIPNGDAIFLKWILHSWSNDDCVRILKNCWNSIPSKGKVIVMEKILPLVPDNSVESQIASANNLLMYSNFNTKERTIEEYKALALASGFSECRPICSAYGDWIIEFHKN